MGFKIKNGVLERYTEEPGVTEIVIPDGVTKIGKEAFYNCTHLTSVTIPNGVTSIGGGAFSLCSSLTSITIPDGVTSIADFSFMDCSNLKTIIMPKGVTTIGEGSFLLCSNLEKIIIPDSVTSIGAMAFLSCSGLVNVTIPASVKSIGGMAFRGCSGLVNVTIPASVKSIGENAFMECDKLQDLKIPEIKTSAVKKVKKFKPNPFTYEIAGTNKLVRALLEVEGEDRDNQPIDFECTIHEKPPVAEFDEKTGVIHITWGNPDYRYISDLLDRDVISAPVSFIHISSGNKEKRKKLAESFQESWSEFVNDFLSNEARLEWSPGEIYADDDPTQIQMEIEEHNDGVDVVFSGCLCMSEDFSMDFAPFWYSCVDFIKSFFSGKKLGDCKYECVLILGSQTHCADSIGGVDLLTNMSENIFEYSFNRLLPVILDRLCYDFKYYSGEERLERLNRIAADCWMPVEGYERILNAVKDVSLRARILEIINAKREG